ncbi:MAG: GNAT family N-acetyltransferase [Candidatus Krumholzibacteria bacterium]|nr:GNAT family N-acetyltransferase [Candidatus Krumholzibacteria bacterium]
MRPRPPQAFHIRAMEPDDKPAILALARSLTQFFPEDVIELISQSLNTRPVLLGDLGKEVVGFLVYAVRDSHTAEIVWMGVKEEYHGLGLGSLMLDTLEKTLADQGIQKLVASTLSYTVKYKPFEKVRTFYYHRGFTSMGIQNNYYEDGMDRLILVKNL